MRYFIQSFIAVLCVCCALAAPYHANAEPAKTDAFTLHYAMYAGGFQAMTIRMDFTFAADNTDPSYSSILHAKPYGILGHFLPWAGDYSVTGITYDKLFYPQSHIKQSQWREDRDQYIMTYRNRVLASVQKIETEDGKTTTEDMVLNPEMIADSVDIMTAAIRVMQRLDQGQDCNSSSIVFDGKRRFRLDFTAQSNEDLTASRYNIFTGPTFLCQVEMIPLKGYGKKPRGYYKIQEAARKRGQLPQIWFGKIGPDQHPIPVKMLVRSEYGAIFVHLQKITPHPASQQKQQ